MKRGALLAGLLFVAIAVVAVLALWRPRADAIEPDAGASRADAASVAAAQPVAAPALIEAPRAPAAAPDEVAASAPEPVAAPAPPAEKPDLAAKVPLELLVVDELDQPVFDASIRIEGMRSETDPGSWYQYRGEALVARTDPNGSARLERWVWVNVDGRTRSVDLTVVHPEFVPFRDDDFGLAPGERKVVLQRGAVVSVRAWHGSPNQVVADVGLELEREAQLGANAWTRESDGRMVTTRIAPGSHLLRVTHQPKERGAAPLYSAVQPFDVQPSERVDLVVELRAATALEGRLDASVPRPVVHGRVQLTLHAARGEHGEGCLASTHETEVRADGTFTFRDLPPGSGHVFVLCRGHVSRNARAKTLAEAGVTLAPGATREDEERALAEFGDLRQLPQSVVVPLESSPFVVEMTATGSVEIAVVDESDASVAHADVSLSPNLSIPDVGSSIVPWREWTARSDAQGRARFDDLPPDPSLWFGAAAAGRRMREADRKRLPSVVVESGKVARGTIVLERDG